MTEHEHTTPSLSEWFETALGRDLLATERHWFNQAQEDAFGFHALQIGMPCLGLLEGSRVSWKHSVDYDDGGDIVAEPAMLPFSDGAIDLLVLPHGLELSNTPHDLLREAYRVLRPEGKLLISAFNPYSLWGLRRYLARDQYGPWQGNFLSLWRVKDWLSVLGFTIEAGAFAYYSPPTQNVAWLRRWKFLESMGDRWWPVAGGVYFLAAKKRIIGARLIQPKFQMRARRTRAAVAATSPRHNNQE